VCVCWSVLVLEKERDRKRVANQKERSPFVRQSPSYSERESRVYLEATTES